MSDLVLPIVFPLLAAAAILLLRREWLFGRWSGSHLVWRQALSFWGGR